jgi:hypothetical protein
MKKTKLCLQVLTVISGLLLEMQAWATAPLYDYVTGLSENESYYSGYAQPIVGYDFVPNTSITIGALGAYDHHFDGLYQPNQVGLWERSTGTLLASATVPGGSVSPLQDGYRWVMIEPITLTAGFTYTIASWNSGWEPIGAFAASSLTVDSRISLGAGYVDTLIPGLQMPTRQGGPGYVFIGPGFASVVPEPSSFFLLISAAGPIYLYRSRKIVKK